MRCNGRQAVQNSLHFVTTCSFPPGSFLGAIQRVFFDVQYARSSAVAHRHIGAACWLVTAHLYNLKRPKSQFCSTMRAFCMIGILMGHSLVVPQVVFKLVVLHIGQPQERRLGLGLVVLVISVIPGAWLGGPGPCKHTERSCHTGISKAPHGAQCRQYAGAPCSCSLVKLVARGVA
jgi:hypothetical protein